MSQHIKIPDLPDILNGLSPSLPVSLFVTKFPEQFSKIRIASIYKMYGSDHKIKRIPFYELFVKCSEMRLKSDFHSNPEIQFIPVFIPELFQCLPIRIQIKPKRYPRSFFQPFRIIFIPVIRNAKSLQTTFCCLFDHLPHRSFAVCGKTSMCMKICPDHRIVPPPST